ncbi:MAG: MFS transporter [Acidobacteriota bacterium]|nr:MFS transporter [Acidobacteriota bacterium]
MPTRIQASPPKPAPLTPALVLTFATGCGLAVGNIYYAQPLTRVIGREFHVGDAQSGAIVTLTQLGYVCGLFLMAPLGDLLENRRTITVIFSGAVISALAMVSVKSFSALLAAAFALGFSSVIAQMLVPFAAHLAPPEKRGEIVGKVMSGLLMGILLARAFAGIVSGAFGWRTVYLASATLVGAMIVILRLRLPQRAPTLQQSYGSLILSLAKVFRAQPVLRRRGFYQACMLAAFSIFWTGVTFLLSGPRWHFSQTQIGLFALAGAAGALFTSLAGHWADRGYGRWITCIALLLAIAALALTLLENRLWALVSGAVLLDLAVNSNLVTGQQAIYELNAAERSRINTLFIAMFMSGAAIGSALAGLAYTHGGWGSVVWTGAAFPAVGFFYWLTEA